MGKRKLIASLFSLMVSLCLSVTVTLAWFVISNNQVNFPPINVESPLITSYEMNFFSYERMYRYDSVLQQFQMYDSVSGWVAPAYNDPEDLGKTFSGIFLGQYDPLISINNYHNNMIVELKLNYVTPVNTSVNLSSISNKAIAAEAISIFEPAPGTKNYLSEVVNIQHTVRTRIDRLENENIFASATDLFAAKDVEGNLIYPLESFYDVTGYVPSLNLGNIQLTATETESSVYIYFNFSYNEGKILEKFSSIWGTTPAIRSSVHFFQDITFLIRKNEA